MELWIIIWLVFGVLTAMVASSRGLDVGTWAAIGCLLGVIGFIAVFLVDNERDTLPANQYRPDPHRPEPRPGDVVQHYRGHEIKMGYSGYIVHNVRFKTILEAQKHIDANPDMTD